MNEPLQVERGALLDAEAGDIVVTKDGTRRVLILKKTLYRSTNRAGVSRQIPYYSFYTLYFHGCVNLVGQTDHNVPLYERAWRKVDNENN
jgi:hypothetical protein